MAASTQGPTYVFTFLPLVWTRTARHSCKLILIHGWLPKRKDITFQKIQAACVHYAIALIARLRRATKSAAWKDKRTAYVARLNVIDIFSLQPSAPCTVLVTGQYNQQKGPTTII